MTGRPSHRPGVGTLAVAQRSGALAPSGPVNRDGARIRFATAPGANAAHIACAPPTRTVLDPFATGPRTLDGTVSVL